jgi:hypothetical protein
LIDRRLIRESESLTRAESFAQLLTCQEDSTCVETYGQNQWHPEVSYHRPPVPPRCDNRTFSNITQKPTTSFFLGQAHKILGITIYFPEGGEESADQLAVYESMPPLATQEMAKNPHGSIALTLAVVLVPGLHESVRAGDQGEIRQIQKSYWDSLESAEVEFEEFLCDGEGRRDPRPGLYHQDMHLAIGADSRIS